MFTTLKTRTVTVHPVLIVLMAVLFGLLVSSLLTGADSRHQATSPPALLPDMSDAAKPLPIAAGEDVWRALAALEAEDYESAVTIWENVAVDDEAWRQLVFAYVHLRTGTLDRADAALQVALKLEPENAVVHFFAGQLCLERTRYALEYEDAVLDSGTRRVLQGPPTFTQAEARRTGKPRSRHEWEAIREFELAVRFADRVNLQGPIMPVHRSANVPYPVPQPSVSPTVEDLLVTLRAQDYVAQAQGLLIDLYLEHGCPSEAEQHVDEAVRKGTVTLDTYRRVGEMYDVQGRDADAHRAYLKAMRGPARDVEPTET